MQVPLVLLSLTLPIKISIPVHRHATDGGQFYKYPIKDLKDETWHLLSQGEHLLKPRRSNRPTVACSLTQINLHNTNPSIKNLPSACTVSHLFKRELILERTGLAVSGNTGTSVLLRAKKTPAG